MAKIWIKSRRLLAPCLLGIIFTVASFIAWVSDDSWINTKHKNIEIFEANKRNLLIFNDECDRFVLF